MIAETICSAVSAAGLGIAAITAYRRRFLAATRIAAYALVPVALVMTGVIDWLADKAFSPTAWVGVGLLALAWTLFATTRMVERRAGVGSRKERRAAARAARRDAVEPAASAPSLGASAAPASRPEKNRAKKSGTTNPADDFSDVEAILKKHGI
ncbi:hypothetical protein OG875_26550 [Streptomyces sp. NBC_01498]|uniref:hypothetical protein n=1 Tax=Streptomyces sp. NBC_01498 TaxID=2975870 RepID=UPI002E7BA40B|nr:hypothetical protein [Streptomyces sp. NBC_01498]WTL27815.1 hypothetical protein OG875_26550 [Streptomyces sp. NBC_01498]